MSLYHNGNFPFHKKFLDLLDNRNLSYLNVDLDIARHRGRAQEITLAKFVNVSHSSSLDGSLPRQADL